MLLCKRFELKKSIITNNLRLTYDRTSKKYGLDLIDGDEGFIDFPVFFAAWCVGYEGLEITESALISVRFSDETPWLSIQEARQEITYLKGAISLQVRLRRSTDGTSPTLSTLAIGYRVNGSVISYLHNIALLHLLARPITLQRIVEFVDSEITDVSPIRVTNKTFQQLDDRFMVNFEYHPIVIATQGEFQGGELPAVLVRLESQSNRRELGVPQYLRNSESTALRTEYGAVYDIMFEISVIAQRTEDIAMIVDRICQTISNSQVDLPPFGIAFGASTSGQIVYDDPIRESDLAGLPTATFKLTVHNVPVGQSDKLVDLITEINPVNIS